MTTVRTIVVVLLALAAACRAAATDYYFYPNGPRPPDIPPDTPTSHGVPLATWEDAAIDANASGHAFGGDEWAHVECGFLTRPDAQILFKFADAYGALEGQVESATLHLHLFGAACPAPIAVLNAARITNAWMEGTVTWDTRPALGSANPGYGGTPAMNSSLTVDVTTAVAAEQLADAGSRLGIGIGDGAGSSPYMATKESQTAAYRPFLHVAVMPEPAVVFGAVALFALRFVR